LRFPCLSASRDQTALSDRLFPRRRNQLPQRGIRVVNKIFGHLLLDGVTEPSRGASSNDCFL
jgi:hypothetical protein